MTVYQYTEKINLSSDNFFIIAHGGSKGMESPFIQEVFNALFDAGASVAMFNFTYLVQNRKNRPGLMDELDDLWKVYQKVKKSYPDKKIHLVGKSLGGIVASWLPDKKNIDVNSISILGCVVPDVTFGSYSGPVFIIQGDADKFGTEQDIRKSLQDFTGSLEITTIPNADHSYRVPDLKADSKTGETQQKEAVTKLIHLLQAHNIL